MLNLATNRAIDAKRNLNSGEAPPGEIQPALDAGIWIQYQKSSIDLDALYPGATVTTTSPGWTINGTNLELTPDNVACFEVTLLVDGKCACGDAVPITGRVCVLPANPVITRRGTPIARRGKLITRRAP